LHKTRVNFWSWWDRPVADWAKASGAKQFLFISSAGIYKSTDEPPHVEGVRPLKPYLHSFFHIVFRWDALMMFQMGGAMEEKQFARLYNKKVVLNQDEVKGDAGHKIVEDHLAGLGFESWASFRPQYMTGSGNNKDCEEWFFDRM